MAITVRKPQKVRWIGEGPFVVMVRSDSSDPEEYRVDLTMNKPVGKCGCPDYQFRKEYADAPTEERRCKHIKQAIAALGKKMVEESLQVYWRKEFYDKIDERKKREANARVPQGPAHVSSR